MSEQQFVPIASAFKIPDGAPRPDVELQDCGNCYAPTPVGEIVAGICRECTAAAERVATLAMPPEDDVPAPTLLPADTVDELEARRARRKAVRDAAAPNPQGWIQHAVEAVRTECVRARTGHEFTADTVLDNLERAGGPMPPVAELQGAAALRFVMDEAMKRGWCEQTGRVMPGRRGETMGKRLRIYRSTL